jgi:tRNA (guanine-N7-)-methyltransferase
MSIMDTPPSGLQSHNASHSPSQPERRRTLTAAIEEILPPGPITLEIGCGHGHFLTAYAQRHAEFCIGIDISRDRIARAKRKRNRAGLAHLHFVHCNASDFLACLPVGTTFSRVFALFPDPWPKRRHHKHRLFSASFLSELGRATEEGGGLFFRTDHRPYFLQVATFIERHPAWAASPEDPWPCEEPTVFEQRANAFFSLVARRIRTGPSTRLGKPESPRREKEANR